MATSNGFQLDKNIIDLAGQDGPGGVMPLSLPNTGRIYYDLSENAFKVSTNETAFVNLATGGGIISVNQPLTFNSGTGALAFGTAAVPTTADANADVIWGVSAVGRKALVLQGLASQTANVFEVQASNGTNVFAIDAPSSVQTGTNNHVSGAGAGAALTSGGENTIYGSSAGVTLSTGQQNVLIGRNAGSATANNISNTVVIGYNAGQNIQGGSCVLIGSQSGQNLSSATNANTMVGNNTGATDNTVVGCVVLGSGAQATASNQFVAGSAAQPVADVYFGEGVVDSSPAAWTLNGTGGSGTNIAGAALQLAGGKGTGTAEPGLVVLKYPLKTTSGAVLQTLSTQSFPVSTNMFTANTANVTVDAAFVTTTETTFIGTLLTGSRSLEGGLLRAGRVIRVSIRGTCTTSGTPPTSRFRIKIGGTAIHDTGAITLPASLTGRTFQWDTPIIVRTLGASGTTYGSSLFMVSTAAMANIAYAIETAATVDTTTTANIDCTVQYSAGTAGNTITVSTIHVEILA